MRSSCTALVASALAWLAVAACSVTGASSRPPTQIGLQQGDLPADLSRCPASGDVTAFARSLPPGSPAAQDELLNAWEDLKRQGATRGAVTVYAAQPAAACSARLGSGEGANVTSLVVEFRDEGAAEAAYRRGVLGFTTPSEDAEVPDLTRGAATGLGQNAWLLQRSIGGRSLIVGLWHRHAVLVLFLAVDEDPLHAKQALSSVDGRIP
jgi:hypothetical protein